MFVGEIEIVPLLDAVGELAELSEAYPDVPAESWAPYRELYPEVFAGTRFRLPVTVYLVRSADVIVLVDTGIGPAGLWEFWAAEREGLLPPRSRSTGSIARRSTSSSSLTCTSTTSAGTRTRTAPAMFPQARYVVHPDALAFALERPGPAAYPPLRRAAPRSLRVARRRG